MEEKNKEKEEEILLNQENMKLEEEKNTEETTLNQDSKTELKENIDEIDPKSVDIETKKISKLHIIFRIIALAFVAITAKFGISIIQTNMIPTKYIIGFSIFEIIITLPIVIGLIKKNKTIILNIFCLVLVLVLSIGYTFVTHYIDSTMDFVKGIFKEVTEVEEYYVVVHKDCQYNQLSDANNKDVYIFQIEEEIKEEVQNNISINLHTVDNLSVLGNGLLNKEIEIIIISASQYNMLTEEFENFEENIKIINTQTHNIQTQDQIEDENTQYQINKGVFNVYISGIDTYGSINKVSRSDVNMIVTVNTNTHEILLTSIPRDYYVTLHSKKAKDKLTHSGIYGINETVATVEDLLGIEINYYIRVNFSTFTKIIDTIGGIDVYSAYSFSPGKYNFYEGYNHLNGEEALIFCRDRFEVKGGDNGRIRNHQRVVEAIINKVLNSDTILTQYNKLLESLSDCFHTNIDLNDVNELVKYQLEKMPSWTIKNYQLTGTGTYSSTYSMGSQQLYVMLPNQNSVNEAKKLIQEVMEGE